MKRLVICVLLGVACMAKSSAQVPVTVGATVQLTQGGLQYTGILVKPNELAPCNAKSHKDDIVFNPSVDTLVVWPRPCPQMPRNLTPKAIQIFLTTDIDLVTASAN